MMKRTESPSRRAVLLTGAWAAPVIALAVATPAAAASATDPGEIVLTGMEMEESGLNPGAVRFSFYLAYANGDPVPDDMLIKAYVSGNDIGTFAGVASSGQVVMVIYESEGDAGDFVVFFSEDPVWSSAMYTIPAV